MGEAKKKEKLELDTITERIGAMKDGFDHYVTMGGELRVFVIACPSLSIWGPKEFSPGLSNVTSLIQELKANIARYVRSVDKAERDKIISMLFPKEPNRVAFLTPETLSQLNIKQ